MLYLTGEVPTNKNHPGRKAIHTGDQSKTVQSARDDADINVIVKRMARTGVMPTTARVPTQGDFTDQVTNYHTAINLIRTAEMEFLKLPAKIRSKFKNDPQNLMDFLVDPQNNEESYKLGLRIKPPEKPEPEVMKVRIVADEAAP